MTKKRKNAGQGYGMQFHGSFGSKEDAKRKERQVHGFIKPTSINGERRYTVMSERKNPRKRNPRSRSHGALWGKVYKDPESGNYVAQSKHGNYVVRGATRKEAKENLRRAMGGNPMDLVVMGANPTRSQVRKAEEQFYELSRRESEARRAGSSDYETLKAQAERAYDNMERLRRSYGGSILSHHNPGGSEIVVQPGQTITLRVNPYAATLRESFTGMSADRVTIYQEPHMPKGNYGLLFKLLALYVKPNGGGQVLMIKTKDVQGVTDENERIWFVGGDQDVTDSLEKFGARDRGAGLFELGEARRIDYKQRKPQFPHVEVDEWKHNFGEDNGVKPTVLFDQKHKRLLLEGGDYRIKPEGIVN